MSSLTISITEMWRSSSLAPAGVAMRSFGVPGLRSARNAQADSASAAISRPS